MNILKNLFNKNTDPIKAYQKKVPKCCVCRQSSEDIHAAYKSKGIVPIGNGTGICPQCHSAYCTAHSIKSNDGWSDNKCPKCKVELDFYWDNEPSESKPWRIGPPPSSINK